MPKTAGRALLFNCQARFIFN